MKDERAMLARCPDERATRDATVDLASRSMSARLIRCNANGKYTGYSSQL